ncbi:glycoprotease family protein, partial [Chlamydia psittaci 84-8471/1]|jgi:hypothetical protein
MML